MGVSSGLGQKPFVELVKTLAVSAWENSPTNISLPFFHFLSFLFLTSSLCSFYTELENPYEYFFLHQFISLQSLSHLKFFAIPWTITRQASLSITNSRSLPKFISIESVMPSNHIILCRSLLLPLSIFPSIRVFSNESVSRIRWPKYWSFSFSISPSNEYSGLISLQNGLVRSPSSPRDSQESSPTPQFKSINSSVFSFLYSPTLTSIHNYWKNHSFDQTDRCWQSNVSALNIIIFLKSHLAYSTQFLYFSFFHSLSLLSLSLSQVLASSNNLLFQIVYTSLQWSFIFYYLVVNVHAGCQNSVSLQVWGKHGMLTVWNLSAYSF